MLRLRPLPFQSPVIGDVQQLGVEVSVALTPGGEEQADETELIGGILLATEHRQTQLGDQQVTHLVQQGEFGIHRDEACAVAAQCFRRRFFGGHARRAGQ
ncbi:hypothetical protein D3C80_1827300 [compost metagenome]